jgi:hypothetical protein
VKMTDIQEIPTCEECGEDLTREECGDPNCDCHGSPLVHYSTGSEKCPGKDF